jgi:hypothetical protein
MKDADPLVLCDQFALEVGKCDVAEIDRRFRFPLSCELRVFAGLSYIGMPIMPAWDGNGDVRLLHRLVLARC